MVQVRRHLFGAALTFALAVAAAAQPRFYPDDPVWATPDPLPVGEVNNRGINPLYDFLWQSGKPDPRPPEPALGVNTLGEVPDSAWFTNRHARRRMTIEALRRGPDRDNAPVPPYTVTGAKTEGITPGFRMRDAKGRLYFVKPDPVSNPEMATAADVIGAKFFYALGYNTPENYIFHLRRSELSISSKAELRGPGGRPRPMNDRDIDDILERVPRRREGDYRLLASLALEGRPVGPFRYSGVRADDPNDTVPHERRRDLRGLHVLCAWLNHTDSKSLNTLDTVVERDGVPFLRHHLIDFGAMLGSDSDIAKDARNGNEYMIPRGREALVRVFSLGLYSRPWERAHYPKLRAVGRFEGDVFEPEKWKPNYPNPAFLSRQPDDEYWAAKLVMAFRDDEIRAIVETGDYSNPRVTDHITATLIQRRDKIGHAFLTKVLPFEDFRVSGKELRFADLVVEYGFAEPREYEIAWRDIDNGGPGRYRAAEIHSPAVPGKRVTVYIRGENEIAGIERTW